MASLTKGDHVVDGLPGSQIDGQGQRSKVVPVRHYGRWIAAIPLLGVVVWIVKVVATTSTFGWPHVAHYFLSSEVLIGLLHTLELTVIAMAIGIALGCVLAIMRLSPNPILKSVAAFYTWFFRGTPTLVQLIFWFNLAFVFPSLTLRIPFGPTFWHESTNSVMTPLVAAILGLGLNEGAYMSEIVRAGILSVDEGQTEAAHAFGLSRMQTMRHIILPQAMRVIIPPTGNDTIGMLKYTSLASVIAFPELLQSVTLIYNQNFEIIPLLIVASLWYIIVTSVLYVGQGMIERRFSRGSSRRARVTYLGALFGSARGRSKG